MKKEIQWISILFFALLLSTHNTFGQSHHLGIKIGYQSNRTAELGVGYAYSIWEKGSVAPGLMLSPAIGVEHMHHSERNIVGAKMSLEAYYIFFAGRVNIIRYEADTQIDMRLRPEIGLSFFGLGNVFYGYNIPLSKVQLSEIQGHKISFLINIPLKEL